MMRNLSTYWPDRIRCNVLCLGGVDTGLPADFVQQISERIPIGRMAEPSDYHGALIFLLSDALLYMNGAIVPLDGGRSVW